jgi:hypothetical protein
VAVEFTIPVTGSVYDVGDTKSTKEEFRYTVLATARNPAVPVLTNVPVQIVAMIYRYFGQIYCAF